MDPDARLIERVYLLLQDAGYAVELGHQRALATHPRTGDTVYVGEGESDYAAICDLAQTCGVDLEH